MPKSIAFLMDPLSTVIPDHDTTHDLIRECNHQGYTTYVLGKDDIEVVENRAKLRLKQVVPNDSQLPPYDSLGEIELDIADLDCLWIRLDPPFDSDYLTICQLLEAFTSETVILNHPNGIRSVNEKLWCYTHFPEITPKTAVSRQISRYKAFLEVEGTLILKPINGYGGSGVFKVEKTDSNAGVIFETLSKNGQEDVIMQPFIPEASIGDKRILLLNGEVLAAVLRVHNNSDHRNNAAAGGRVEKTEITDKDQEIIQKIAPKLRELGLYFVGIDIIGDYLIEVNVTSPTCLQEANRLDQKNHTKTIIDQIPFL